MTKARTFRYKNTAGWLFNPFNRTAPMTMPKGLSIGVEQPFGRPFGIDEYKAQRLGLSASGRDAFFGDKGKGKTLAAKVNVALLGSLQSFDSNGDLTDVRIHVHNRRSDEKALDDLVGAEWAALMRDLGAEHVNLEEQKFGLFDPSVSDVENFARAIDYLEYLRLANLTTSQMMGLRIAVHKLRSRESVPFVTRVLVGALRALKKEDIQSFHNSMDNGLREELAARHVSGETSLHIEDLFTRSTISELEYENILAGAVEISNTFALVLDGNSGAMYTGIASYTDMLRRPALIHDYGTMRPRQIGLIELMREHATSYARQMGDTGVAPNVTIEEEIHKALTNNIPLLRQLAHESSTARETHERRLYLSQYPTNYMTGDTDTEERNLGIQFSNGFDTVYVAQLPNNPGNCEFLERLHLSQTFIKLITGQGGALSPGTMLVIPKDHPPHLIDVLVDSEFLRDYGETRSAPARHVDNRRHVDGFEPNWPTYPVRT